MVMNEKGQMRTILIVVVIVIVLGLSAYFVVKGLSSSTGKVITNNGFTDNAAADNNANRITTPARAANTNPNLTSNNLAKTSITGDAITEGQ